MLINKKFFLLSEAQVYDFFHIGYIIIKEFFDLSEIQRAYQAAIFLEHKAQEIGQTLQASFEAKEGKQGTLKDGTPYLIKAKMEDGSWYIDCLGTRFVIGLLPSRPLQIQRVIWAAGAYPSLLPLCHQPKMLDIVWQLLYTDEAEHLINQLHYKLPGDGVQFDWHQDVKNRRSSGKIWQDINKKGSYVQTLIALEEMSPALGNGPLMVVPGLPEKGDLYLDTILDEELLRKTAHLEKAIPLTLKAGDMVLMHPHLIHGSLPNTSQVSRRVLINGFAVPGANKSPYPGKGSGQKIKLKGRGKRNAK